MQLFSCLPAAGLLMLLIPAGVRSVQLARAEWEFCSATEQSVQEAARIDPGRALYRVGVAESQISAGRDSRPALRQAVSLQPDKADYRIRLGLQEERFGNQQEAERQLLEAARVSRKYAPRWALANYYLRRGDRNAFWRWANEALLTSYAGRKALFDLCRSATSDMNEILTKAIPDRRIVRMEFAGYLLENRKWELATQVLSELAEDAAPEELATFLHHIDRLIAGGRDRNAAALWDEIAGPRQSGSGSQPDLGPANRITNGEFTFPPLKQAFGWRIPTLDGVYQSPGPAGGWQVTLTGEQPENCEILWQYLLLEGGARYRLRSDYSVSTPPFGEWAASTRLLWRLDAGRHRIESAHLDARERHAEWDFTVPETARFGRIILYHRRERGSTRMEGTIRLERVTLEVLAHVPGEL